MKKIVSCLIISALVLPAQGAFWNRNKIDKALEAELEGKGYAGTLPNIQNNVQTPSTETKVTTPIFELQNGFNNPSDLKPVPKNNPAFIDIIQKKDKTSAYVTDVNDIIPMLEKLLDCIEDDGSIQLFVTRANVLSMNLDYLIEKYEGQPESYYESFKKLEEINRYIKTISLLRREALTYQRYLSYQSTGSIYNPENINQQLEYLKSEINTAVIMLKQEE